MTILLLFLTGALCFTGGCSLRSNVDPISPEIRGVDPKPTIMKSNPDYFYQKYDREQNAWYEAKELIPPYGMMVYTINGLEQRRKDYDKNDRQ